MNCKPFVKIYANSTLCDAASRPSQQAITNIKKERRTQTLRLEELNNAGKLLEAQRLEQRVTMFDMEMMEATGVLRRH